MSRRPILGLWGPRTDAARRTKGDPPPTYAQLETTVTALTSTLKTQGEIIRSLRSQVDGLNKENRKLRTALAERTDDVGTMAAELAEIKAGGICGDEAPALFGDAPGTRCCILLLGHPSVWHRDESGARWKPADVLAVGQEPKPTLREERIGRQSFPTWPEHTYEATYQPLPADVERDWAERHLGPGGER